MSIETAIVTERRMPELSVDERLKRVEADARKRGRESEDPYQRAFYIGWDKALKDPTVRDAAAETLSYDKGLKPAHYNNRMLRVVQEAEWQSNPNYPLGLDAEGAWEDPIMRHFASFDDTQSFIAKSLRDVSSNIAGRSAIIVAILQLAGKSQDVSVMEHGTSQRHLLTKMDLFGKGEAPYRPLTAVQRKSRHDRKFTPDEEKTERVNRLFNLPFSLGKSVGTDIISPFAPEAASWARTCSFYPVEIIQNHELVEEYDRLSLHNPDNIGFFRSDVTDFDYEGYDEAFPDLQKADALVYSTMLYQVQAEGRRKALEEVAPHYVKDDGLIIILDYFDKHMRLREDWPSYSYKAIVKDMSRPELGYQKVMSIENGRAQRVKLEPAIGNLALAKEFGLVT